MVFVKISQEGHEILYDYYIKKLNLWQVLLLSIWFISIYSFKVYEFVQLVIVTRISKFLQLSSFKPSISLQQGAQPTQNALYHNQKLAIQPNEVLLLFLLDAIIVDHIFSCLPMILSLSWYLCQISKSWFRVMSESMAWNALEVATINHRLYLQSIIIHEIVRQSIF